MFTGCALGWVVSSWIFSGTYAFLASFALMAVVAQNEYYNMARANGCYPTRKLGLLGSTGMYCAACSRNPVLRDALFPMTGVVTIVYLLLRQEEHAADHHERRLLHLYGHLLLRIHAFVLGAHAPSLTPRRQANPLSLGYLLSSLSRLPAFGHRRSDCAAWVGRREPR